MSNQRQREASRQRARDMQGIKNSPKYDKKIKKIKEGSK